MTGVITYEWEPDAALADCVEELATILPRLCQQAREELLSRLDCLASRWLAALSSTGLAADPSGRIQCSVNEDELLEVLASARASWRECEFHVH